MSEDEIVTEVEKTTETTETEIEREIDETAKVEDVPERDDPDTEKRPQDDPGAEGR